ncbi:hypothetical protein N7468_004907 [Penicillium chermesinum]|uniref:Aldehyde dehydrogenase n=1 Tax=Penicillium chermesinum TaxID=63820 RepID=A0A9W9P9C6_9EURO|nr:uncharacterized protein N7468_004907 [Penicillium chermesinum]KAJ5240288.1 hypothetical protein N7468_004907 [Penicillium chermesinum]
MAPYSTEKEILEIHEILKQTFASGRTKELAWRKWQLKQLWWLVADNEDHLNRHPLESMASDIAGLKGDILEHIKHLEKWTRTVKVDGAGILFGTLSGAKIRKDPLGVALILGAWNFPILLILQPLIAAISAGCCALLKPSEMSTSCSELLDELVPQYLDTSAIRLVTGGPSESTFLLSLRFDKIFFTGSSKIARIISAAAAKHLTPVVLELGGQGPTIVTKSADIELAARRISWAKFTNAGQICLSVNHVFAEPEIADKLVERLGYWNEQYLSQGNDDMCRVINDRNFNRLTDLLDCSKGQTVQGGQRIPAERYIAPTIVDHVTMDDSLMSEELFGPILPVLRMSAKDAVTTINSMPSPLALYIFSGDTNQIDWIINSTISGGVTVNNVMLHAAVPNAPFGGVGEAGYGAYHGPYGIDSFSHRRVILQPPKWLDKLMGFTYPPYSMKSLKWLAVKNSLGFKRGETLEDQRRSPGAVTKFIRRAVLGGLISSIAYYLHLKGRI